MLNWRILEVLSRLQSFARGTAIAASLKLLAHQIRQSQKRKMYSADPVDIGGLSTSSEF